ncbi:MAG: hypothetical protein Q4F66_02450 [Clostridium sp.]|nr:hypothetical protein [Clostridium sp.]
MKKSLLKISTFILLSSIIISPISVQASEISQKSAASESSASFVKNFLLQNDENKKLAADSLNFNSYWNSAQFLTAAECFNSLVKSDGNLIFSSLKSNPDLMLTIVNVDVSSHLFQNTSVPAQNDNPVLIYQIASEKASYPLLWIVDAVTATVYSTQDYSGAAIYELKDNTVIRTYSNNNKCLLWR